MITLFSKLTQRTIQLPAMHEAIYFLDVANFPESGELIILHGQEKIAEVKCDAGKIVITGISQWQMNIRGEIICKELLINTSGPLVIADKITTQNKLSFSALSISLAARISSRKSIECKVERGIKISKQIIAPVIEFNGRIIQIEKTAKVKSNTAIITSPKVKNFGMLAIKVADFHIDALENNAEISLLSGNVKLKTLTQSAAAVTDISSAVVIIDDLSLQQGMLRLSNKSELIINERCFFDSQSQISIADSSIKTNSLVTTGKLNLKRSYAEVDDFINDGDIDAQQTELLVKKTALLGGKKKIKLSEVNLTTGYCDLRGNLVLENLNLIGNNLLIQPTLLKASECLIKAESLTLTSDQVDQEIQFNHSSFVAKRSFTQRGTVRLCQSKIIGLTEQSSCHSVRGQLMLDDDSVFISNVPIYITPTSSLTLTEKSRLSANHVEAMGNVILSDATVIADSLTQFESKFVAAQTNLTIKRLASEKSAMTLLGSTLVDNDILAIDGSLQTEYSDMNTSELLTSSQSMMNLNKGRLRSKKTTLLGEVTADQMNVDAGELQSHNDFSASFSRVGAELTTNLGGFSLSRSLLQTQQLDNFAEMSSDYQINVEQQLINRHSATLALEGAELKADKIQHDGKIRVKKRKYHNEKGEPDFIPTSIRAKKLNTSGPSETSGDTIMIEAEELHHYGDMNLSEQAVIRGKHANNYGDISAPSLYFGFDRSVLNMGDLSGDQVTVHAPFFTNALGLVNACDNFSYSGLSYLNVGGIIFAGNAQINSVVSLNAGLVIPNLVGGVGNPFSFSNLWTAGKMLTCAYLPQYASAINLVGMLPGLYQTGAGLYKTYAEKGWQGIKSMRAHEWMPHLAQLKSAAMLGYGAYSQAMKVNKDWTKTNEEWAEYLKNVKPVDWNEMAWRATSLFGGHFNNDSLFSANVGAEFAQNTMHNNLWGLNAGIQASLQSHVINTQFDFYNVGGILGGDLGISAGRVYNNGLLSGQHHFSLEVDALFNQDNGQIVGHDLDWKVANTLNNAGELNIEQGKVDAKNFAQQETGSSTFENINASFENLELQGQQHLINAKMSVTNNANITGHLFAEQASVVSINHLQLEKSGSVQGETGTDLQINQARIAGQLAVQDYKTSLVVNHLEIQGKGKVGVLTGAQLIADDVKVGEGDLIINQATAAIKNNLLIDVAGGLTTKEADVSANQAIISGEMEVAESHFKVQQDLRVEVGATVKIQDSTMQAGRNMRLAGNCAAKNSDFIAAEKIDLMATATMITHDVALQAEVINHDANHQYSGLLQLKATSEFNQESNSYLQADLANPSENLLAIQTEQLSLQGKTDADNGLIKAKNLAHANDFIAGRGDYVNQQYSDSLIVKLDQALQIDQLQRDCDLAITGKAIEIMSDVNQTAALHLTTTENDITNVGHDVKADLLILHSARDIRLIGGGSYQAEKYLEATAERNIDLVCKETKKSGKHTGVDYKPATMIGGSGLAETEGLGLNIHAKGKLTADVANFVAPGDIYLAGDQGVELKARAHEYLSRDQHIKPKKVKDKITGKRKHIQETSTDIGLCHVASNSRAMVRSEAGTVDFQAVQFAAAQGTDIHARDNVNLRSLKVKTSKKTTKENFHGLKKKKETQVDESSVVADILNNGIATIQADNGDVDLRGAYIHGSGNLAIKAGKRIRLGRDVLNHQYKTKSRKVTVSVPGKNAYDVLKNGGNGWDAIAAIDSTAAKIHALAHSATATQTALNSANLATEAFNTAQSIARGIANDALAPELMARYGVGGAEGFSPAVTVGVKETKKNTHYQTLGVGGIDQKNISLEAGEAIDLENGVNVHASANIKIKAPEVNLRAAALELTHKQSTDHVTAGVNAGGVVQASASHDQSRIHQVAHVNAVLVADGEIDFGDLDQLNLIGGEVRGATVGNIKTVNIETLQDTSVTRQWSANLSSSGQFGYSQSHSKEKTTQAVSGIFANSSTFNEAAHLAIGQLNSTAGAVNVSGNQFVAIDHTAATELTDSQRTQQFSLQANANDFARLLPEHLPTHHAGEKAIATAGVSFNQHQMTAQQRATVYAEPGASIAINAAQGDLNQESADGYRLIQNKRRGGQLDIPLTNTKYLKLAADNISQAAKKLTTPSSSAQMLNRLQTEIPDALVLANPEEQILLNQALEQAQLELQNQGEVSAKTEETIKDLFLDVSLDLLKAGSEEGFAAIMRALSDESKGLKFFVGAKGQLITFGFNVARSAECNKKDILIDAALDTAADATVTFVFSQLFKGAAGAIGWGLLSAEIIDKLTYNKNQRQAVSQEAQAHYEAAWQASNPAIAELHQEMADRQHKYLAEQQILHGVAEGSRKLNQFFRTVIDHAVGQPLTVPTCEQ